MNTSGLFLRLTLLFLCVCRAAAAETVGTTEVLAWPEGKRAAVVLTFDDGLDSQQRHAVAELGKRKLQATFYPNPAKNGFSKKAFWQEELPKLGHEYGVHTMTHRVENAADADEQIRQNVEILRRLNPASATSPLLSFARPGPASAFKVTREEEAALLTKHQLVSRDTGLFMYVGQDLPVLEKWLNGLLAKGTAGHICFHGVGGDYIGVKLEVFTAFLDAIVARQERLWVAGHTRVHKYATERASAQVAVLAAGETRIALRLTSAADPALYDQPLTLRTRVPASWKSCTVVQGTARTKVEPREGSATFTSRPGGEETVLTPE